MKKYDIILLAVIITLLLPLAIVLLNSGKGGKAIVKSDGKVINTLSLDKDSVYTYQSDKGFNTVEVKDRKVRVLEADCPNKDCVNKGYINKNNESVICLPHRFEVIVKSSDEDYDIIVQ